MKVIMTKNAKGANDGIYVNEYQSGKTYDLSDSLANNFLVMGVAKTTIEDKKPLDEVSEKLNEKSEDLSQLKNKAITSDNLKNKSSHKNNSKKGDE
jgi:hypothetical protein